MVEVVAKGWIGLLREDFDGVEGFRRWDTTRVMRDQEDERGFSEVDEVEADEGFVKQ